MYNASGGRDIHRSSCGFNEPRRRDEHRNRDFAEYFSPFTSRTRWEIEETQAVLSGDFLVAMEQASLTSTAPPRFFSDVNLPLPTDTLSEKSAPRGYLDIKISSRCRGRIRTMGK